MKRILIIANKVWELYPLMDALLNPRFQPDPRQPYLPVELYSPWRFKYGDPIHPRAVFAFENARIEIWCIADHMDPDKNQSSSQEKARIMPAFFTYDPAEPALVVAFGTASASPGKKCNGSVFMGSKVFMHDGHPAGNPNPDSEWRSDLFDKLIDSDVSPELFGMVEDFRPDIQRKMMDVSVNPVPPVLQCLPEFVAVSTVNVTNYKEYAVCDPEAISAFQNAGVTDPIGSVETTHGVIRAQSDAPFMFISGIPNGFGRFDEDMGPKPEAQNYAAGFNAGIVAAYMLPLIDKHYS